MTIIRGYLTRAVRATAVLLVLFGASAFAQAAVRGRPSEPRTNLPGDKERRHAVVTTQPSQEYSVDFRGAVDGAMTRMPASYVPYHQGWQPNLWARIENVGETDVLNPWITVNGRGDWRTLKSIVAEATRGCTTDEEKARALYEWQRTHRFHACTWDKETRDAVKVMNVYGYTLCQDEAPILSDLLRQAGLRTRPGHPMWHAVTEVFYDGGYHLLDSDQSVLCLLRDNKTIASETQVVRDHDLMKRTHVYSILATEDFLVDQFSASFYYYTGERQEQAEGGIATKHAMHFTLRPGEALEWRWDHVGKEYSAGTVLAEGAAWAGNGTGTLRTLMGGGGYALLRNGKWTYRPPLDKVLYRKGIVGESGMSCAAEDGGKGRLHPAQEGKPATVIWRIASPYVLVGGSVHCGLWRKTETDSLVVRWSRDGNTWKDVAQADRLGDSNISIDLDEILSPGKQPMYDYLIQVEMQASAAGGVGLDRIEFDNDVQMSLLGMPELTAGINRIRYLDESPGDRNVKVTHAWLERAQWHPPAAVQEAVFPKDGGTAEGTHLTFRWSAAEPGDKDNVIVDYHVQVSDRQDMRWPLSPNFDRLISRTRSAGKAEWSIPYVGLLNPETTYYWRVRGKDNNGVWGPWSQAFRFRCAAPGVPLGVKVVEEGGVPKALLWDDDPAGANAVSYRVYGSNEQGFTASDADYLVHMGAAFCDSVEEYQANCKYGTIIAKTPSNLLGLVREKRFDLSGRLYAFYRIAAVDEKGNVSGASDYVELPRPFIYSSPILKAKVGEKYTYRPIATSSIGHFTCREGYKAAFWDREKLQWTLETAPKWLTVKDGEVVGRPEESDAGAYDIVLKVANSKKGSAEQRYRLVVEK